MSAALGQLARVQALASERRNDDGLYDHQREPNQTFSDVLCYLLGLGAISDAHLDTALRLAREGDERTRAARAAASGVAR